MVCIFSTIYVFAHANYEHLDRVKMLCRLYLVLIMKAAAISATLNADETLITPTQAHATSNYVASPIERQSHFLARHPAPPSLEIAIARVQKALTALISVLDKLLVLGAVFAFLALQYIVFRVLDALHRYCSRRRKSRKEAAAANAESLELGNIEKQRY